MKRLNLFLLILVLVTPTIVVANPDGPNGSIVLEPRGTWDSRQGTDQQITEFGTNILVPAGRYVTVRGGVFQQTLGRGTDSHRARFEIAVRIYVPLTKGAQEKLRNWE
jgi:hypothetical protein